MRVKEATNVQVLRADSGTRDTAPPILNLDTRWRWVFSFTLRLLLPRVRNPGTHWVGFVGGPQSRSGCVPRSSDIVHKMQQIIPNSKFSGNLDRAAVAGSQWSSSRNRDKCSKASASVTKTHGTAGVWRLSVCKSTINTKLHSASALNLNVNLHSTAVTAR